VSGKGTAGRSDGEGILRVGKKKYVGRKLALSVNDGGTFGYNLVPKSLERKKGKGRTFEREGGRLIETYEAIFC